MAEPTPAPRRTRHQATPSSERVLGYCTNVHAGATLEETKANLDRHATRVRDLVCRDDEPLPIGLWLSAKAARSLVDSGQLSRFRDWLDERRLRVFTLNGFPWGDFHQPVVKHRVYSPRWSDLARLNYTRDLILILSELIDHDEEGSISTLPIGWGKLKDATDLHAAASLLHDMVKMLAELEHRQQKLIHLDLEPEPGCLLQTSEDVVAFLRRYIFSHPDSKLARRHVRICHDVCHAAVMFEDQRDIFERYAAINAKIGKVQLSSAVAIDFDALGETDRAAALEELRHFGEERYLHQTMIRSDRGEMTFHEDLPDALAGDAAPAGEWRVHFHVPIFCRSLGMLNTTQETLRTCAELLEKHPDIHHLEVETYAWDVLPEAHRKGELAEDIARELAWAAEAFGTPGSRSQRAAGEDEDD